jgi:predicted phosphodiesterase
VRVNSAGVAQLSRARDRGVIRAGHTGPVSTDVVRTLVHLSDLHFGASPRLERRTVALVDALHRARVDHVVVTGDVTEHGRRSEFERFLAVFDGFAHRGQLTVVPGNHDRLGDDVGDLAMAGERVQVRRAPGLHLVLCDSTRPGPGFAFVAHGSLVHETIDAIERAAATAASDALVAVLLHHHVLPRRHESVLEAVGSALGLPFAGALPLGAALLQRLRGRCDLVLHGHRHRPFAQWLPGARPLGLFNAGCSPALAAARRFVHARGRLLATPAWLGPRAASAAAAQHPDLSQAQPLPPSLTISPACGTAQVRCVSLSPQSTTRS